jgi:hypothetical protein
VGGGGAGVLAFVRLGGGAAVRGQPGQPGRGACRVPPSTHGPSSCLSQLLTLLLRLLRYGQVRGDLGEWAARTRSMESTRGETLDPQHKASKR